MAVTFNRRDLVTRLVTETGRGTVLPDEILVVDNASTDDTVEVLRALESPVPVTVRRARPTTPGEPAASTPDSRRRSSAAPTWSG